MDPSQKHKKRALLAGNAFFYRRWKLIFSFLAIGLLILVFNLFSSSPSLELVIEEAQTNKILWKAKIEANDWFSHQYIHSVEKSRVIEKFKISEEGQIFAMESWTKSFGAGLPFEEKGKMEMIDGYFVLKEIHEYIPELHMIPSHLYEHSFHFKNEVILLSEPPYTRNHIIISVQQDDERK